MEQEQIREVARCAYFSNLSEPSITLKYPSVKFNAVCLKKMETYDYINLMVERCEKKLMIEPCNPDEHNAIRWSSLNSKKRKAKIITCREFFRRIIELMDWNNNYRYKIYGKSSVEEEKIFIAFDLKAAVIYKPDENDKISRVPDYPPEWCDSFGETVEQYKRNPLFRRFAENTEITVNQEINSLNKEAENEE